MTFNLKLQWLIMSNNKSEKWVGKGCCDTVPWILLSAPYNFLHTCKYSWLSTVDSNTSSSIYEIWGKCTRYKNCGCSPQISLWPAQGQATNFWIIHDSIYKKGFQFEFRRQDGEKLTSVQLFLEISQPRVTGGLDGNEGGGISCHCEAAHHHQM